MGGKGGNEWRGKACATVKIEALAKCMCDPRTEQHFQWAQAVRACVATPDTKLQHSYLRLATKQMVQEIHDRLRAASWQAGTAVTDSAPLAYCRALSQR